MYVYINDHDLHFKYLSISFVNYTLLKLKKNITGENPNSPRRYASVAVSFDLSISL